MRTAAKRPAAAKRDAAKFDAAKDYAVYWKNGGKSRISGAQLNRGWGYYSQHALDVKEAA